MALEVYIPTILAQSLYDAILARECPLPAVAHWLMSKRLRDEVAILATWGPC